MCLNNYINVPCFTYRYRRRESICRRFQLAVADPPMILLARCPRLRRPRYLRPADVRPRSSVLVHGIHNPIDAGIVANGVVLGVNENDLEIFVGSVLVNPVWVQHAQIATDTTDTLFGDRTQVAFCFEHDTLVLGLTVNNTLSVGTLASTTAHSRRNMTYPCLALYPRRRALSGRVGLVTRLTLGSWRYSHARTRSRKRSTSLCFRFQSSSRYL